MMISSRTVRNVLDIPNGRQETVEIEKRQALDLLYAAYYPNRWVTVCFGPHAQLLRHLDAEQLVRDAEALLLEPHLLHHDIEIRTHWGDAIAIKIPNWSRT